MNILVYLATSFYGFGLIIHGYKELREKRYEMFFRPNILRRARLVEVEGKRILPIAIWHILAGILLGVTSLYMLVQNHPNAFSFVIIWVIVYVIIEVTVGTISIGSLTGALTEQYKQVTSDDSNTRQNSPEK